MVKKNSVSVDIPREFLDDDRTIALFEVKEALKKGLNHYFDDKGVFNGIYINFKKPVFLADGKKRINDYERITFNVDSKTYKLLNKAKCYTSMSLKNFAEVVILKEFMNDGGDVYAKDGSLYDE